MTDAPLCYQLFKIIFLKANNQKCAFIRPCTFLYELKVCFVTFIIFVGIVLVVKYSFPVYVICCLIHLICKNMLDNWFGGTFIYLFYVFNNMYIIVIVICLVEVKAKSDRLTMGYLLLFSQSNLVFPVYCEVKISICQTTVKYSL